MDGTPQGPGAFAVNDAYRLDALCTTGIKIVGHELFHV